MVLNVAHDMIPVCMEFMHVLSQRPVCRACKINDTALTSRQLQRAHIASTATATTTTTTTVGSMNDLPPLLSLFSLYVPLATA
jgi:hypothetical protein